MTGLLLQRRRRRRELGGFERANRFIAILLALQRLSYLVPVLVSLSSPLILDASLNQVLVTVTVAWNVALFTLVWRHGWFSPLAVWVDVVWAAVILTAVTANLPSEHAQESVNWSGRIAQAAAALAGAALLRIAVAAAAVAVLVAASALATTSALAGSAGFGAELAGGLNGLIWFAVIVGFCLRYLRRQGRLLDELTEHRLIAEGERARNTIRLAHYRALHDTVLATLVAIARGGLDHRTAAVRQRCARDAEHVRRLLRDDTAGTPGILRDRLMEVIDAAEALGLRIQLREDGVTAEPPPAVVDAVSDATRESLNNVAAHAGTGRAWVSIGGENGAIRVSIVDRGVGFDPTAPPSGFGLAESIRGRMCGVGGEAHVITAVGDGVRVDLAWPASP